MIDLQGRWQVGWSIRLRRTKILILCSLALLLTSQLTAQSPTNEFDLYLAIGQSNMAGRAEIRDQDTVAIAGAHLFSGSVDHIWVPLTNPLNRFSTIRKVMPMQRLSPAYSFALSMKEARPEKELGMIVNAKGGTKIVQWLPGTTFYKEAVERTHTAMKYGRLKGIIWCQGESDGDSLRTDMYLQRLEVLINAFREEFDDPSLPFVCSQIFQKERNIGFNKMIQNVPGFISNTGLASTQNLTTTDNTHFDASSTIILGERFAAEMIRILEQP